MQYLEHFCVAKKPAILLVSLIFFGLCTHFLPKELNFLSQLGAIMAYFSAGILAAQHARIWEKAQSIGHGPHDKR
jgi:hypothetical protein